MNGFIFKRNMQKDSQNPVQNSESQVTFVSSRVRVSQAESTKTSLKKQLFPMKEYGSELSLKYGCSQLPSVTKTFYSVWQEASWSIVVLLSILLAGCEDLEVTAQNVAPNHLPLLERSFGILQNCRNKVAWPLQPRQCCIFDTRDI